MTKYNVPRQSKLVYDVYYNLHKHCFSIRNVKTRLVEQHAYQVALNDVSFRVSQAGRQRVIVEKRKNVHAFVRGVPSLGIPNFDGWAKVIYNPYMFEQFVIQETEQPIYNAKQVVLHGKSIYAKL